MKGATDGGAHIEAMRTGRMRKGRCSFSPGCKCQGRVLLEFHHESYNPERGLPLSHHCHHRVHFRPWNLSDREKEMLLRTRYGPSKWPAMARRPALVERLRRAYVAPGRRQAQLEVRREVKERAKIHSAEVAAKKKIHRKMKPVPRKKAGKAARPGSAAPRGSSPGK